MYQFFFGALYHFISGGDNRHRPSLEQDRSSRSGWCCCRKLFPLLYRCRDYRRREWLCRRLLNYRYGAATKLDLAGNEMIHKLA
ncbi:hypothetical protein [Candidatus Odyssella thessalonicensis]|uniref:hypothetical protein n=1 Tax=Candidatus Odyssella thessalonicensis TaxID=84647 RepID=UPI001112A7FA|nr:hypothetical protein [Candidatus Odyssella thessalonicensis]